MATLHKYGLKILALTVFFLLAVMAGTSAWRQHERNERAMIIVNNQTLSVRLADSPVERRHGLSGYTPQTLRADGMLFVFVEPEVQHFWMQRMRFDLDVLWIKGDQIVAISRSVPAPRPGEEPATMTSQPVPVDRVLELPAGKAQELGINPGQTLQIELP